MTVPLTNTSTYLRTWLTAAVGEAEAEQALLLPRELQRELYGDILQYGPAAGEVKNLLSQARNHMLKNDAEAKQFLVLAQAICEEALTRESIRRGNEDAIESLIKNWTKDFGKGSQDFRKYNKLYDDFYYSAHMSISEDWWGLDAGLRVSFWFLTGQHVFSDELAEKCMRCVPQVNALLAYAGMPELSGKLVLRESPVKRLFPTRKTLMGNSLRWFRKRSA